MKRSLIVLIALMVAVSFSLTLAYAQDQPAAKAKPKAAAAQLETIAGVIQSINKETSTLRVKEKRGAIRDVVFSDATKVAKGKTPATLADVKENQRIIAKGKLDQKGRLDASLINIRE